MRKHLPSFVCLALGVAAVVVLPIFLETFALMELMVYVVMSILALSLGLVWGYGGILCFGQAAFFGLGAYTYALAVLNLGESTGALLLAIALPGLVALALGYFIFYGRIGDVYLGVITLTFTLILYNLFNSTSGDQYRIGNAPLGGFNGIPSVPTLNVPGSPDQALDTTALFAVCVFFLVAVYIGLRILLASHFGRVLIAIRENEQRANLLGYDSRRYKLLAFGLGGAIAGLSGCLFANWGAFTSPTVFSLSQSAQVIIWVIVGGVGTLLGPIVGCFAIQWLTSWLGTTGVANPNLVLGAVLIFFVLVVPRGIVPMVRRMLAKISSLCKPAPPASKPKASAGTDRAQTLASKS